MNKLFHRPYILFTAYHIDEYKDKYEYMYQSIQC